MSDNANINSKSDAKSGGSVEIQINNLSDGQIVDISRQLIRGKHMSEFEKFFKSLEIDTIGRLTQNEDFLQMFLKHKLHQGCWLDVMEILKTRERFSKPIFLNLWDEANYQKYQAEHKGDLTALIKYRVRQKNPPPESICPLGIRPRRLLPMKAVSVLTKWFSAHSTYPYPCKSTKARLAKLAGITVRKVTTWFQNARRKYQKQIVNETLPDSSQKMSTASRPPNVKSNVSHCKKKRKTCDAATQSENDTLSNNPVIVAVNENIDEQDCVTELMPLNENDKLKAMTEERQVDYNNNMNTDWVYTKRNLENLEGSLNAFDRMETVLTETSQTSSQDMYSTANINISDYVLPLEHSDNEAQFKYLLDACSWNEGITQPGPIVYENWTSFQGEEFVSPSNVSTNDQIRKHHHLKSPLQENTNIISKMAEDHISQSNTFTSSMYSTALSDQTQYFMAESNVAVNTIDVLATGPVERTPFAVNQMRDDFTIKNPERCVCGHTTVSNCRKSKNIVEQNCGDKWKGLPCSTHTVNSGHNLIPLNDIQDDKGYSWKSANHSQTISELKKDVKWKSIEHYKAKGKDFEWKYIESCKAKQLAREALAAENSNFCDMINDIGTDNGNLGKGKYSLKHGMDTIPQNGSLTSNRTSSSNKYNVKPNIKCVDNDFNCRNARQNDQTIRPVPYKVRQMCPNKVTISQGIKRSLKACLNKGKGERSFLICKKCKEEVKDVGIESLNALQKLCNNIESIVQSPVELAAQICSEVESEICDNTPQQLPSNDQVVPLTRSNDDRPLDMRMESGPLDMTKEKGSRLTYHNAEGKQTVFLETEYCPMSLQVPSFSEELQPINMQITYHYAPMSVQVSSETQPISSQSMQHSMAQSVSPELEVSYGRVVAEAIQGLLNMSSSQESD